MPAESEDLSQLVKNAVSVIDGDELAHYVRWNFLNLLDALDPEDIYPDEYMAANVVLAKALSRKLALAGLGDIFVAIAGQTPLRRAPVLRLVD